MALPRPILKFSVTVLKNLGVSPQRTFDALEPKTPRGSENWLKFCIQRAFG